jgi:hypothetical protein
VCFSFVQWPWEYLQARDEIDVEVPVSDTGIPPRFIGKPNISPDYNSFLIWACTSSGVQSPITSPAGQAFWKAHKMLGTQDLHSRLLF